MSDNVTYYQINKENRYHQQVRKEKNKKLLWKQQRKNGRTSTK